MTAHGGFTPHPGADHALLPGRLPAPAPSLARAAAERLAAVTAARNPRDLDMAIYLLRDLLLRVLVEGASRATMRALSPVLARMQALDRAFDTHLCCGLEPLVARSRAAGGTGLEAPEARAYVSRIASSGAFLATPEAACDWSRALGPAGQA